MTRKIKVSVFLLTLLFSSELFFKLWENTDTLINKIGCRIYEFNDIKIKTDELLVLDKVVVKEGDEIVFKNGRQKGKINQEYGHRVLTIFYDEKIIAKIGNFNTNNWFTNDYEIEMHQKLSGIDVKYSINGPSAKNDNFQKRYIRNNKGLINQIEYLNESGLIYHTEEFIKSK